MPVSTARESISAIVANCFFIGLALCLRKNSCFQKMHHFQNLFLCIHRHGFSFMVKLLLHIHINLSGITLQSRPKQPLDVTLELSFKYRQIILHIVFSLSYSEENIFDSRQHKCKCHRFGIYNQISVMLMIRKCKYFRMMRRIVPSSAECSQACLPMVTIRLAHNFT